MTAELLQRAVLADRGLLQAISGAAAEMPMSRTRRVLRRLTQHCRTIRSGSIGCRRLLDELRHWCGHHCTPDWSRGRWPRGYPKLPPATDNSSRMSCGWYRPWFYPGLLLVLVVGADWLVLSEALPALASVEDPESPLARMAWLTTMLRSGLQGVAILVGAHAGVGADRTLVSGRLGLSILWWTNPVCGALMHGQFTVRYLQSLALLLRQELPLPEALGFCLRSASVGNSADQPALESAVRRGVPLADAMRQSGLHPPSCLPFVEWGESHGRLVAGLEMAQQMLAARLRHSLEWLSTLIPIIVYLLVGLTVLLAVGVMASAVVQSLRWLM